MVPTLNVAIEVHNILIVTLVWGFFKLLRAFFLPIQGFQLSSESSNYDGFCHQLVRFLSLIRDSFTYSRAFFFLILRTEMKCF